VPLPSLRCACSGSAVGRNVGQPRKWTSSQSPHLTLSQSSLQSTATSHATAQELSYRLLLSAASESSCVAAKGAQGQSGMRIGVHCRRMSGGSWPRWAATAGCEGLGRAAGSTIEPIPMIAPASAVTHARAAAACGPAAVSMRQLRRGCQTTRQISTRAAPASAVGMAAQERMRRESRPAEAGGAARAGGWRLQAGFATLVALKADW
jgi:hypothetical protein